MLTGEVVYRHADKAYPLAPGDALFFDAAALHGPEELTQAADDLSLHHHLPAQLSRDFSIGNYYSCQLTSRLARPYFE